MERENYKIYLNKKFIRNADVNSNIIINCNSKKYSGRYLNEYT